MNNPADNVSVEVTESSSTRIKKWPEVKDILNLHDDDEPKIFFPMWDVIFMISCGIGVFLDPVYSYIPVVDKDRTCYFWDQKLMWTFVGLRSAVDLFYTMDIIIFLRRKITDAKFAASLNSKKKKSLKESIRKRFPVLLRIFVALPILQAVALTGTFAQYNKFNLFRVNPVQFVMRIYYTYGSLKGIPNIETGVGRFLQAILDFLPFVLAAHLFGALWYGLALQREVDCWTSDVVCMNVTDQQPICDSYPLNHFYCSTYTEGNNKIINIKHLEEACNIDASPPIFDFGIYLYALQSNMTSSSTSVPRKMLQCFWWGLRNISSFGSNLQTGPHIVEIIFAVLVSITGLVLFLLYLNARVQALKSRSDQLKMERKVKTMSLEVDLWLSKNNLPRKDLKRLKKMIMKNVKEKLEEKKDIDMHNVLSILPIVQKRRIMYILRLASLKEVDMFRTMNEQVLETICEHLKPVTYTEGCNIIQEGQPLEMMLFITQGTAWTYITSSTNGATRSSSVIKYLKRGDLCGEELLNCISKLAAFSDFPISTRVVKAQTRIEGFALGAHDLKSVVSNFWWHFRREELDRVDGAQLPEWEHVAASFIQEKWRLRHHA
ncbi:cyclic nucleotide-gated ion channel 1-like isoform X2 [Rosa rugosa]|uniref:cyclic nucleotide-gated ion channel 1-like isoform X2 n=1 Tax=Rosa rugosa TaxID=74645 RepID=UPI002B4099EF|nr:cyclic nucleotide-gated ion channel 1-like isoform X2 [Rosa rugosa]XP_061995903.1 cyclic nucleotide-gated ion channel 1-like isoform X2 [Rosa rugosa]